MNQSSSSGFVKYLFLILTFSLLLSESYSFAVETTPFTNFSALTSYNYVFSKQQLFEMTGGDVDYIQVIQYFDGLGRPLQTVNYQASPLGNDVVQPYEYNTLGLEEKKYLPYAETGSSASGLYRTTWKINQQNFLSSIYNIPDNPYGYAQTIFENSPLHRVLKQGAPGGAWQPTSSSVKGPYEHVTAYQYLSSSSDIIYYWTISGSIASTVTFTQHSYSSNRLYKTIVTDENDNPTTEYKDKQGKVVLKVDATGGQTCYIYDDFDLLRCVLPPMASKYLAVSTDPSFTSSENVFQELCYYYEYDERHRMVKKKLPGTTTYHEMTYDNLDRLVETKDPVGNRINTTYDVFSRPVQTTEVSTGDWLTKNYYDNYSHDGVNYDQGDMSYTSVYSENIKSTNVKGLATVTLTRIIYPLNGMVTTLININYYDKYGRIIQTISQNHKGGIDRVSFKYLYKNSDLVIEKKHQHGLSGTTVSQTYTEVFTYDHQGRLLTTQDKINTQTDIPLTTNTYNEAGELTSKNMNGLQTLNYKNNIRGWLTQINDPSVNNSTVLFNMKLEYATGGTNSNNISIMTWKGSDNTQKKYSFAYDGLNRLLSATYTEPTNTARNGKYDVIYTYDENGNILTAKRKGAALDGTPLSGYIDDLNYVYMVNSGSTNNKSNRLKAVGDATVDVAGRGDFTELSDGSGATEYAYDANGNMTYDGNKAIYIYYNILNLPKRTLKGSYNKYFSYSSVGMKVASIYVQGTARTRYEYFGPFVYKDEVLDHVVTSEGRAVFSSGNFSYFEYFIKDHLGNNRVTFRPYYGASVQQRNDFYPFGMLMQERYNGGLNENKYLYNGKEFETNDNLDWYDYGWRMYDPQLGRFHTPDAFAEKYIDFSPYNYAANNPIKYIDVNGDSLQATADAIMAIYYALDKNSNVKFNVGNNGMIDPESFKDQAEKSDDIVLKDLYEIASNEKVVEMSVSDNFNYKDNNGNTVNSVDNPELDFRKPNDFSTYDDDPIIQQQLKQQGEPSGSSFTGSTGQSLYPGSNSPTGLNSTNGNIQIIINGKGTMAQRAVGVSHEFGHVVLYLRSGGQTYRHGQAGVDKAIYKDREDVVKKRVGYDF